MRPVELHETPQFPTDNEAMSYAKTYHDAGEPPETWRLSYRLIDYSETIQAKTSWGINHVFFVVAYPPLGITIDEVHDVEYIQLFEGWIIDYNQQQLFYSIRYKASVIGYDEWKRQRRSIKLLFPL